VRSLYVCFACREKGVISCGRRRTNENGLTGVVVLMLERAFVLTLKKKASSRASLQEVEPKTARDIAWAHRLGYFQQIWRKVRTNCQ
jgi:hypothetical protein